MTTLFYILLFLIALFIIFLVLIQKGKGGGLAGAFGGLGGQSVFGSKAGDLFTKITIGSALCWILLCIIAIPALSSRQESALGEGEDTAATADFANGASGDLFDGQGSSGTAGTQTPLNPTDNADAASAAAANVNATPAAPVPTE